MFIKLDGYIIHISLNIQVEFDLNPYKILFLFKFKHIILEHFYLCISTFKMKKGKNIQIFN